MGFFDALFNPAPCSAHQRAEVDRFVQELIQIGRQDDFLAERPGAPFNYQCRHTRARDIGVRLNELGGDALMEWVHRRVRAKLKEPLASHLSYAWTDIGDWVA